MRIKARKIVGMNLFLGLDTLVRSWDFPAVSGCKYGWRALVFEEEPIRCFLEKRQRPNEAVATGMVRRMLMYEDLRK